MKLGKVEFCHLLQIIALFLCLSGMNQAEPSRSRSKPYFQSGRTRTKRSWVWNQFFVLEEYMGSDPLYVGKVGDLSKLWKVQMPAFQCNNKVQAENCNSVSVVEMHWDETKLYNLGKSKDKNLLAFLSSNALCF